TNASGTFVLTLTASGSGITDLAGNALAGNGSTSWTMDVTPPIAGTVNDGAGADLSFQSSTTTIAANWSGFSDAGSGIASYQWAIGTTAGGTNLQEFTNVGNVTSASASGLSLSNGTKYYVNVKALDKVGNVSSAASSNGVTVDTTPPSTGSISDGLGA